MSVELIKEWNFFEPRLASRVVKCKETFCGCESSLRHFGRLSRGTRALSALTSAAMVSHCKYIQIIIRYLERMPIPDSMSLIVFWERLRTLTIAWASPLSASSRRFGQGLLWELLLLCSTLSTWIYGEFILNIGILLFPWYLLENKRGDQESPHNPVKYIFKNVTFIRKLELMAKSKSFYLIRIMWWWCRWCRSKTLNW